MDNAKGGKCLMTFYSSQMEKYKTELKSMADMLKGQDGVETPEFVLSFRCPSLLEEIIVPHWREFVEAVKLCDSDSQYWALENVQVPPPMLEMLLPALITRDIHTLKISHNFSRGSVLFGFLCEVIKNNSNMKRLIMKHGFYRFDPSKFAQALCQHPSLEELHFGNMHFGLDENILKSIMYACKSKNMKYLTLHNCSIGENSTEIISTSLEYNYGLSRLDLVNVDLVDSDAARLAEALRSNTNLRFLSMTGIRNGMSDQGRKALLKALFNASSLDSIAESNHTCSVRTVEQSNQGKWKSEPCPYEALLDILNRNSCQRDNLKWKVLSVLYATRGKVICEESKRYHENKVLPELLALISEEWSEGTSRAKYSADEDDISNQEILSIESDSSFDGYDSELDDLDDTFEEVDPVFDDFGKSFTDLAFTGGRARLTILFQVLKLWALPLLDRNPSIDPSEKSEIKSRPKRKHRELESLKNWSLKK